MASPRDPVDDWLERQVTPLSPPPGTLDRIRHRARRRKVRQVTVAAAGLRRRPGGRGGDAAATPGRPALGAAAQSAGRDRAQHARGHFRRRQHAGTGHRLEHPAAAGLRAVGDDIGRGGAAELPADVGDLRRHRSRRRGRRRHRPGGHAGALRDRRLHLAGGNLGLRPQLVRGQRAGRAGPGRQRRREPAAVREPVRRLGLRARAVPDQHRRLALDQRRTPAATASWMWKRPRRTRPVQAR